jgi:hypothetical protein
MVQRDGDDRRHGGLAARRGNHGEFVSLFLSKKNVRRRQKVLSSSLCFSPSTALTT